ncbi:N-6 DNA methylase [Yinghuangia seranimata]|uniref:N-6 DNA methylase n=1 Tax=Yinghuangia seranimata TaxID=408067 RepID=UPI00248B5F31|nr:N-6 DNA methylase [Yinghuangia seranimata]MDI2126079.1 N-6 DNA methylase [Yinghuangia seranimata]
MAGPQVTAAEIARIAGVGRAAVSNWRRRFPDFPQRVGGSDSSPTFALDEVEAWLRAQGKIAQARPEDALWRDLAAAAGDGDQAVLLAAVGEYLLGLGAGRPVPSAFPGSAAPVLDAARARAGQVGAARAFDELYARYADSGQRSSAVTPPRLAALMVAVATAGRPAATVLDPACGTGDLLLAALDAGEGRALLAGQDADPGAARLAAVRLAFAALGPAAGTRGNSPSGDFSVSGEAPREHSGSGLPFDRAGTGTAAAAPPEAAVETGDALRRDAWPDRLFDAVLANPPFNDRNWGHDGLAYDPRWAYGLPPKTEGELAWIQHALARTAPGGTVVVLMPPAVASRGSGRRIRAELLRSGALRAVVGLPAGAAPPAGVALQLWVLTRPAPGTAGTHVLFVDTAAAGAAEPARREPDWDAVGALALDAWTGFAAGSDRPEVPGVRRAVPVIDLLDDAVDLTPAHNLPTPAGAETPDLVADAREDLADALALVARLAPGSAEAPPGTAPWRTVAIADLTRGGGVTLLRGPVRAGRADAEPPASTAPDALRVLTAADVTAGTAPSGRWSPDTEGLGLLPRIQRGDVIVPAVLGAQGTTVRVAADRDHGALLGPNLHLLRPDPQVLNPWFLAGFLSAPDNTRQATYGSSIVRLDVRRFEVPLLPLDVQRHYAAAFHGLYAFNDALRRVETHGTRLAQGLLSGLTSGVLTPPED